MLRQPPNRTTGPPLSAAEQALWRGFLAWSETVMALVARDLSSATGLSRADFEILVRLHEAPRNTLTQRDLRESLGWSASRLSHQLERMQARDLVTSADTGVGRLRDVRLTEHGAHEIAEAIRVHDTAVRTHFLAPLDSQTQALKSVLQQRADAARLHGLSRYRGLREAAPAVHHRLPAAQRLMEASARD